MCFYRKDRISVAPSVARRGLTLQWVLTHLVTSNTTDVFILTLGLACQPTPPTFTDKWMEEGNTIKFTRPYLCKRRREQRWSLTTFRKRWRGRLKTNEKAILTNHGWWTHRYQNQRRRQQERKRQRHWARKRRVRVFSVRPVKLTDTWEETANDVDWTHEVCCTQVSV